MQQEIMLSIVCPTYNQGLYLAQGMESILMQKVNFQYEVLIGEDCSPDNSLTMLREYERQYPDRIKVFHREQNLRQSKNVYDLFMKTQGKYVCILDLDDFWTDENKLQKQVDFLEKHKEYIGVACDFDIVDANGQVVDSKDNKIVKDFLNKDFTLQDFLDKGFVFQTGTFLYRNVWCKMRENQEDFSILYKADHTVIDLTILSMLLLQQNIFILEDNMSAYRVIIQEGATNARSVGGKDLAYDIYNLSEQLYRLYHYFEKQIDYSTRWSNLLWRYFKGMMARKDKRYKLGDWLKMYRRSSKKSQKIFCQELKKSIMRAIKRRM